MIALIDLYGKELLKVNGFYPSTVETYLISIKAFCGFVKDELKVGPDRIKGPHLIIWMRHLKHAGAGQSRMEHHHYALKSFFGFLEKSGRIRKNPADVMPLMINRKRNRTMGDYFSTTEGHIDVMYFTFIAPYSTHLYPNTNFACFLVAPISSPCKLDRSTTAPCSINTS